MDFETLATASFMREESPELVCPTTYDPFTDTICGSLGLRESLRRSIQNDLKYQMDIQPYFKIKKVIFNNPATIVYWEDGTKTVVKCGKDDTFDEEKGLALCFMKKALGNKGNYNNVLKEHTK